jgi:hypothetical protein
MPALNSLLFQLGGAPHDEVHHFAKHFLVGSAAGGFETPMQSLWQIDAEPARGFYLMGFWGFPVYHFRGFHHNHICWNVVSCVLTCAAAFESSNRAIR